MTSRRGVDNPAQPSVLYEAMKPAWDKVVDLIGGTRAMRLAGNKYLPKEPLEDAKAYSTRLNRSFLYNGLKGGISKIVSYPFSRPLEIRNPDKLPEHLAQLETSVDGVGTTMHSFARDFFESMIAFGHAFIFVDWPVTRQAENQEGQISVATEKEIGARVLWRLIRAPDMLGWEHDESGKLVEIRFREARVEKVSGKRWLDEEREYVKVVRADGTWELWRSDQPLRQGETLIGSRLGTKPHTLNGNDVSKFKRVDLGQHTYADGIPIVVGYANKTGEFCSEPPLIELAETNIEHWQSNSDQRNILRFARLAQKVATGVSPKDAQSTNFKASVHNVIAFRDPAAHMFYLEHSGSGISAGRDDLKDLEDRMRSQGLQPLTQVSIDQTATGSMIDLMNVSSDTQAWVMEEDDTLLNAMVVSDKWHGGSGEIPEDSRPKVFSDFSVSQGMAQDFTHVLAMRAAGLITRETTIKESQRRSIISETVNPETELEEIDAEAEEAAEKAALELGLDGSEDGDDEEEKGGAPFGEPDDEPAPKGDESAEGEEE